MISATPKGTWAAERKFISLLQVFENEQGLSFALGDGRFSLLLIRARASSAAARIKRDLVSGALAGALGAVCGVLLLILLLALFGSSLDNVGPQELVILVGFSFFFGGLLSER